MSKQLMFIVDWCSCWCWCWCRDLEASFDDDDDSQSKSFVLVLVDEHGEHEGDRQSLFSLLSLFTSLLLVSLLMTLELMI
jgi:hypothetical protein